MAAPRITLRLVLLHMQEMQQLLLRKIGDVEKSVRGDVARLEQRMHGMEQRMNRMESRIDSIDGCVGQILYGMGNMDERLDEVEIEFLPKRVKRLEFLPKRVKKLENKVFSKR